MRIKKWDKLILTNRELAKLAEKKAVIEQRDRAERTSPEKENEKKSQREM